MVDVTKARKITLQLIRMKRTNSPKNIGISFGEIKHFHDGIGEFSRQFGLHLAARAPELMEQGITLYYHLPKALHGSFGSDVHYLNARSRQRHIHIRPVRFDIWHSLNQHIRLKAPVGTRTQILTLHDLNLFYFMAGKAQQDALQRQLRNLNRTDVIVTISDFVKRDIETRLTWTGPVQRIYNGVRSLTEQAQSPIDELRNKPFFFHISRMAPSKNVSALVDLASIWPEKTFVFAGPRSEDSEQLAQRMRDLNLHNTHCYFNITDEQKSWLYQNCEAILLPSLTEGFGLPTIEAMHFGQPVFLSDRTCMPEIGGDRAYYWHHFEPEYMKEVVEQGLAHYIGNPGQPDLIKAHAARFRWDHCIDQYLALYRKHLSDV